MTMIDTSDNRFPKAVALADLAGQWLKCRTTSDGRKAYGVPSQCTPGRYYLTTQSTCTCEDAARHPSQICKHRLAVQIHCARLTGKPIPEADVVGGLAQMVTDRQGPVLDLVRETDGSLRWERYQHTDGSAFYIPRSPTSPSAPSSPASPASPARPDIFKRFVGD